MKQLPIERKLVSVKKHTYLRSNLILFVNDNIGVFIKSNIIKDSRNSDVKFERFLNKKIVRIVTMFYKISYFVSLQVILNEIKNIGRVYFYCR